MPRGQSRATAGIIACVSVGLLLTGCVEGGKSQGSRTETRTVVATADGTTPTTATTTSSPSPSSEQAGDPLAGFKRDPDSSYDVAQQRFLYLLKIGTSEDAVTNSEIQLLIVGSAICDELDEVGSDEEAWSTWYDGLQLTGSAPADIPTDYIALAAGASLCPKHKSFVLSHFDQQFG